MFFCLSILSACFAPKQIKEMQSLAKKLDQERLVDHQRVKINDEVLHYVERGGHSTLADHSNDFIDKYDTKNNQLNKDIIILWLHGTPGSWAVFSSQLSDEQLLQSFKLIAIDRPSWGESTLGFSVIEKNPGDTLTIASQLELLEVFINTLSDNSSKLIVAGHSLGGTMAPMLALRFPDKIDAVISIAGDLSASLLKPQWYNRLASTWLAGVLLPKELLVANEEVLSLPDSLLMLNEKIEQLNVPFLAVFGENDSLVDAGNIDFVNNLKTQSDVQVKVFENEGHLFHINKSAELNKMIKKFVLAL